MIKMKLSENDMIETWKEIIQKNINNAKKEKQIVEEETEDIEDIEDINEQEEKLYETDQIDTPTNNEENNITSEEIKIMIEEAKKLNGKEGIFCLIDLLKHKENWLPSECIKYGIYQDYTSNRVEGFFGHLKRLTKHNRLLYYMLTDHVYALANTMYNNIIGIELPDGIIDKSDEKFKSLTEFTKKVLKIQYEMMIEGKSNENNQYCVSCEIRKINSDVSWPCSHLMMTRQRMRMKYLINYEDLPKMALKSKRMNIIWSNKSINNIELPKEYTLMGIVVMNKQIHNTNVKPRNKVEYRRRSSKDVVFNELTPFRVKRKSMIENNKIEEDINIEIEKRMDEEIHQDEELSSKIEIINNKTTEEIDEEISEYDSNINQEQFMKIINTFEVPTNCLMCELSENGKICQIPNNIKGIETIIFPFKLNKNYGMIAYVNRMKITKKKLEKCLVHLKSGKSKFPYFMNGIRKILKERYSLRNEPWIHPIQLDKYLNQYKHNSYLILFMIETFLKTRNSKNKNEQKEMIEYLTTKNMIKSFRRYKGIIN